MVAPQVPRGGAVVQAILGDQTDGHVLDAAGVLTVGQSQIGEIDGEAAATAGAAMAGESDHQIDGVTGPGVTEVMHGAGAHDVATGAVGTARAASRGPVAAATLEARLGQVFDTGDTLGDIGDILTWPVHRLLS